ncbi:hypothetical protein D6C89_07593 [Aureobasidium pullulans]|nr:hypothetical protein D6C89_07593 [Aureobasidium pullulans]
MLALTLRRSCLARRTVLSSSSVTLKAGNWCHLSMIENFMSRLSEGISPNDGVLRILEMGAGTGGTS